MTQWLGLPALATCTTASGRRISVPLWAAPRSPFFARISAFAQPESPRAYLYLHVNLIFIQNHCHRVAFSHISVNPEIARLNPRCFIDTNSATAIQLLGQTAVPAPTGDRWSVSMHHLGCFRIIRESCRPAPAHIHTHGTTQTHERLNLRTSRRPHIKRRTS